MPGLVPGIHVFVSVQMKTWMAGTSPALTITVNAAPTFPTQPVKQPRVRNSATRRRPDAANKTLVKRGRRKRRVLSHTHSLMCKNKKAHKLQSPQVWPDHPAFPARLVLTGSFVLFPVIGLFCHRCRSRCASIVTCVTPASRRQNHTTSPSAASVTRQLTASRPSHPALYVRDDRETPLLMEAGWRINAGDLALSSTRVACDTLARRANHLARAKCCQAESFSCPGQGASP
jgi:hypothetical protein